MESPDIPNFAPLPFLPISDSNQSDTPNPVAPVNLSRQLEPPNYYTKIQVPRIVGTTTNFIRLLDYHLTSYLADHTLNFPPPFLILSMPPPLHQHRLIDVYLNAHLIRPFPIRLWPIRRFHPRNPGHMACGRPYPLDRYNGTTMSDFQKAIEELSSWPSSLTALQTPLQGKLVQKELSAYRMNSMANLGLWACEMPPKPGTDLSPTRSRFVIIVWQEPGPVIGQMKGRGDEKRRRRG